MSKRRYDGTLLLAVMAELGQGRIESGFIHDKSGKLLMDGFCDGKRVAVSEIIQTVDTICHELLHRRFPHWSEPYIRNRTTYLLRRMTEAQIQAVYDEFQRRAVKRKSIMFPE
jgi:hypothetical protein